jgi:hypothetical protein
MGDSGSKEADASPLPDEPTTPVPPPWCFSGLNSDEKALIPPSSEFVPPSSSEEEEDGSMPRYELVLHHPDRANGTIPVRAGGAGTSASIAMRAAAMGVAVERAQMQVDELRQFKALCDRLLPGLRTQSHLYTLIHLCDRTHTVTLAEFGEVIGGATFRIIQATDAPCLLVEVLLMARG